MNDAYPYPNPTNSQSLSQISPQLARQSAAVSGDWQKFAFLAWFSKFQAHNLAVSQPAQPISVMCSQRHPDGALKISAQIVHGAQTSSTRIKITCYSCIFCSPGPQSLEICENKIVLQRQILHGDGNCQARRAGHLPEFFREMACLPALPGNSCPHAETAPIIWSFFCQNHGSRAPDSETISIRSYFQAILHRILEELVF